MCRVVNCKNCNKTTWAGCGNHVDSVMASVPKSSRCSCDRNAPKAAASNSSSWLARLFGK